MKTSQRIARIVGFSSVFLVLTAIRAQATPTATDMTAATQEGLPVNITLNVTDPVKSSYLLECVIVAVNNGTVTYQYPTYYPTYSFYVIYTPNTGFTGSDTFTFKCSDGATWSETATCTVTVVTNTAPVANSMTVSTVENKALSITLNVSDSYKSQYQLECVIVSTNHGNVAYVNPTYYPQYSYSVNYTPEPGFRGTDTFTFKCSDGQYWSDIATCTVDVRSNAVPIAFNRCVHAEPGKTSDTYYVTYSDPDGQTMRCMVESFPANGTLLTNYFAAAGGFQYVPNDGFSGPDAFSWKVTDGIDTSAAATCRVLVHDPASRTGQLVIVVVETNLFPNISNEVVRLGTDLENEGYTAKIKLWKGGGTTTPSNLWNYLWGEYGDTNQFLVGSILIGDLPKAYRDAGVYTDRIYWNLCAYRTDALYLNQDRIWVSRIMWPGGPYGDEITLLRRALQANHDYRTGASRLPHMAYSWVNPEWTYEADASNRVQACKDVWPDGIALCTNGGSNKFFPSRPELPGNGDCLAAGGELWDETSHGDTGSFYGMSTTCLHWMLAQVRYIVVCSCSSGAYGGVVHNMIFSRNGGCVFSVGGSIVNYVGDFTILSGGAGASPFRRRLKAGESFGTATVMHSAFYGMSQDTMFYGDLSMGAMAAPSNTMPVVQSFTADVTQGAAPLTVQFSAAASDPDGTIESYEWFPDGNKYGTIEPAVAGSSSNASYTYTRAHCYQARVEVADNYKARTWKEGLEIRVAPDSTLPFRINCGYYNDSLGIATDYEDQDGNFWLYDQRLVSGTWGYDHYYSTALTFSGPVADTLDPTLFLSARYDHDDWGNRTGLPYVIPLSNGTYTVRLGFADMQNTQPGQRLIDMFLQDEQVMTAYDIVAAVGPKTATTVERIATVTNGVLRIVVKTNPASPTNDWVSNNALVNCLEIIPGGVSNAPPVARDQSVYAMKDSTNAITLRGVDPNADPLTYAIVSQPAHGTLSGTAPHVVYAPEAGYLGSDSFTFKVNDGHLDSNTGTVTITVADDIVTGILGWWRLNEGSGSVAADSSGNGISAALMNGAGWAAGKTGQGLSLDGVDDYARTSTDMYGLFGGSKTVTITAWFKATAGGVIITEMDGGGGWHDSQIEILGTGEVRVRVWSLSSVSLGTASFGAWHHVALRYDQASQTLDGFLDGVEAATDVTGDRSMPNSLHYGLGKEDGTSQGDGTYFNGVLDDVRVYGRALSASEIAVLANPGTTHTIMVTAGTGGRVDPCGTVVVADGASQAFDIVASNYYHVAQVLVDGISTGALSSYMFVGVTASHTLLATFGENLCPAGTPEWWMAEHGWTNNFEQAELLDPDGDSMANWKEYRAGTIPTNGASRLQVSGFGVQGSANFVLSWASVAGKYYRIEYATNLMSGFAEVLQSNILATPPTNSNSVPASDTGRFYRIKLEE